MGANCSLELQVEAARMPQPRLLLTNVHKIYHEKFWRWFGIMVPTSLLAGTVLVLVDLHIRQIFRGIPRGQMQQHLLDILTAGALRYGGFFLSWLLGCFALAAIATIVNDLDTPDNGEVWRRDSFQRAREHIGPLFAVAAVTFIAFLSGMFAFVSVELAAFRVLRWSNFSKYNYTMALIGVVLVASVVSWLGASIPLLLESNTRVWAAFKKSVDFSAGYEGALFLLVVESVAGSYMAWYAVWYGLPRLLPQHWQYAPWYWWLLTFVGVLAGAAVEPPLFIGFSLIANPERLNALSLPGAE